MEHKERLPKIERIDMNEGKIQEVLKDLHKSTRDLRGDNYNLTGNQILSSFFWVDYF